MIEIIYFFIFISYSIAIFAFNNFIIQGLFACLNLFLLFTLKISFKKAIQNIRFAFPFILITALFNFILGDFFESLLILVKLILICNITFIYKSFLGTTKIISTIEKILFPLNFIGISSTDISLIIHIALTFIPNFIKEFNEIRLSLISKTQNKFSINYIKYISKLLLISTFKKTNELELSLKSKGYYE